MAAANVGGESVAEAVAIPILLREGLKLMNQKLKRIN